jgi:hypothetical protein
MPITITSWLRAFFALEECAIDSHGAVQVPNGDDDPIRWPRTCARDAVAIAAVLDSLVRNQPLRFGGRGLGRRWRACVDALPWVALATEHADNRTLWRTLPAVCVYLHAQAAPLPPPHVWRALLASIRSCRVAKDSQCLIA